MSAHAATRRRFRLSWRPAAQHVAPHGEHPYPETGEASITEAIAALPEDPAPESAPRASDDTVSDVRTGTPRPFLRVAHSTEVGFASPRHESYVWYRTAVHSGRYEDIAAYADDAERRASLAFDASFRRTRARLRAGWDGCLDIVISGGREAA